jgi:type I restriction enzyme, S subunit
MRYKPYPKYKIIENITKQVPDNWLEERLFDVAEIRTSNVDKKSVEGQDAVRLCNYVDVYYHNKITSDIDFMPSTASKKDIERFSLTEGDVVFTKDSEDPFDIGIPSLIVENIDGLVCGYHLSIVKPFGDIVSGEFLYYALESELSKFQFTLASNGVTRFGLTSQGTKNIRLCIPSLDEQSQIAKFLDYKTVQIDCLIEKKKALIKKLNEQRIAVVTHAVSKGLDPNVPMKDSGIDWLGEIPSHWGTRRLKLLAKEPLKYGANEAAELSDRELPRYIRITDVKEDGSLYDETFRSLPEEIAEQYLLEEGDILLARSGATVGKSFQYNKSWGKAAYAGYLIRFRTDSTLIDATFAYLFCKTTIYWANINSTLIQATIQNFSADKYANIIIPLPPIDLQRKIVKAIKVKLSKIDQMEQKTKNIITELTEYRISLITAAVTGKIDVRDVEIPVEAD